MNEEIKIKIKKSTDKIVGALRVSQYVFDKVEKLANEKEVSKQEIIRAILDEVIDKVKL